MEVASFFIWWLSVAEATEQKRYNVQPDPLGCAKVKRICIVNGIIIKSNTANVRFGKIFD